MNIIIKRAIENGELILLLGAGASLGSKDGNNRDLLDGSELTQILAEEAGFNYNQEGLGVTYAAAKIKLGGRNKLPRRKQAVRQLPAWRGLISSKTDRSKKEAMENVFDRVFCLYLYLLPSSSSAEVSRFSLDSLLRTPN
jgi:hypothetical protein